MYKITNDDVGVRLDRYLQDKFPDKTRSHIKHLIDDEIVLVNGRGVKAGYSLKHNDEIVVGEIVEKVADAKPQDIPINIVYEDPCVMVVDKPYYMPVHPSFNHPTDTLANAFMGYWKNKGQQKIFRAINRLDKNTSGVVLVAKNRISASKLSSQMKNDVIKKTYIAILEGTLPENEGRIITHIKRKEKSIILRQVCDECEDSKIAITDYKVLAQSNGLSLVSATPVTGRTHQLRVHFAHLGAQILGDDLYGKGSSAISRHALHAYSLEFTHPKTNKEIRISAPLPSDIADVIEQSFGKELLDLWMKK
jgi:23S rRNA pseudouridine1911/1915/1917 synthase